MIITKQYTYQQFKEAQSKIESLPELGNNTIVFTDVLNVEGESCSVEFKYCIFDEKWIYKSKINKK